MSGTLATTDMQGACFTLSNLGTFGIEAFTPVINPPESAILGIGTIVRPETVQEIIPLADGQNAVAYEILIGIQLTQDELDYNLARALDDGGKPQLVSGASWYGAYSSGKAALQLNLPA